MGLKISCLRTVKIIEKFTEKGTYGIRNTLIIL